MKQLKTWTIPANFGDKTNEEKIATLSETYALIKAMTAWADAEKEKLSAELGPGNFSGNRNACMIIREVKPSVSFDGAKYIADHPEALRGYEKTKKGYTTVKWG